MELTPASELVKQEGFIVIKIKKSIAEKLKATGNSYNQAIADLLSRREEAIVKYNINHLNILEEMKQLRIMIESAIGKR